MVGLHGDLEKPYHLAVLRLVDAIMPSNSDGCERSSQKMHGLKHFSDPESLTLHSMLFLIQSISLALRTLDEYHI